MHDNDIRIIKSPHLTPEQIDSLLGAVLLDPEGLDAALVDVAHNEAGETIAVYDEEILIEAFAQDMHEEGDEGWEAWDRAREWYEYNTVRALAYMGTRAPRIRSSIVVSLEADG